MTFTAQEFHDLIRNQVMQAIPRAVVHFNIAPSFWRARPQWVNDNIPSCSGPGDNAHDHYTTDPARVTCAECLREIEETNS